MKILAFMQNMWLRDPARVQALIAKHGEAYRLRLIHFALFNGCLSGRRLKAAFGRDLCRQIIWEESSRDITPISNAAPPADLAHISTTLALNKPDIVICFGRIASAAVPELFWGPCITTTHPAARKNAVEGLALAAKGLIEVINNMETSK